MKRKNRMLFIFIPIAVIVMILVVGKISISVKFGNQIKKLFAQSGSLSDQRFQKSQVANLPEPVQRYFNHVLREGQLYISYARIKHVGQFKTGFDKDWTDIKGEQYATTEKPGFIWKGTTSLFVARDMYIADKGRLTVSLFSLVTVVNAEGKQYDQGELLRWLGESVLYPTNFLPNDRLHWSAIDSGTANLHFHYNELSLNFKVTFNAIGEITGLETKRYMDEKNLETWLIKLGDYKEFNNVLIPTCFDVIWKLKKGDFSYARFRVTEADYDTPERF